MAVFLGALPMAVAKSRNRKHATAHASALRLWFVSATEEVGSTVDSRKLEHECRVIYAGFPSSCCFGIRARSYSNFLASTVRSVYRTELRRSMAALSLSLASVIVQTSWEPELCELGRCW